MSGPGEHSGMVRPALLPIALVGIVALAGCSTALPGVGPTATPADIDASIVERTASGGTCVENPSNGFVVESIPNDDGTRTITVEANVTVSGAHYVLDETAVTEVDDNSYRLDVNTTESSEKDAKECDDGGIVHYAVTLEVPDTDSLAFQIWHDGRHVSGFGSGGET